MRVLIITLGVFFTLNLNAQFLVQVKKYQLQIPNKPGMEEAYKNIKEAAKFMEKGIGNYDKARALYMKAYDYNPDNAELNYLIALSYIYSDKKYESIQYLERAFEIKPNVTSDIHYLLARAYHVTLDFDKAIDEYKKFKNSLSPGLDNDQVKAQIDKRIVECESGKKLVANPKRVVIVNLGPDINSEYDDYNPVLSDDETVMYFTSRRKYGDNPKRNLFDHKFFEDVYVSKDSASIWSAAKRITDRVNKKSNDENNSALDISSDNKELLMFVGGMNGGDIVSSVVDPKTNDWDSPKRLPGDVNTNYREEYACFSSDNNTLYFISDDPTSSIGGTDIYMVKKDANGKWREPKNLGATINTPYDERSVKLSANDSVMYFSSKGHNSMGDYDIFKSTLNSAGTWGAPENLGYPINTADKDWYYYESAFGNYAYVSGMRPNGFGGHDLYKIITLGSEKDLVMSMSEQLFTNYPMKEGIYFRVPEPMPVIEGYTIEGKILDALDDTVVGLAAIEIIDNERSMVVATSMSSSDGTYNIQLPAIKNYGVQILSKGYLIYLEELNVSQLDEQGNIYKKDFWLEKIKVGEKVILKNIFFEFGKETLKPESYDELDNVVKLLNSNSNLRIEISGHTDNVGSAKTNIKLSELRAKAVVDYLVLHGITATRLEFVGKGFKEPVAQNTTEAGRARNRRVEFKILSD